MSSEIEFVQRSPAGLLRWGTRFIATLKESIILYSVWFRTRIYGPISKEGIVAYTEPSAFRNGRRPRIGRCRHRRRHRAELLPGQRPGAGSQTAQEEVCGQENGGSSCSANSEDCFKFWRCRERAERGDSRQASKQAASWRTPGWESREKSLSNTASLR